jgi:hypothetical protein
MHPENLPLLLILPTLIWIFGIIQIFRSIGPKVSKQLTQSFIYPFVAVLVATLIMLMISNGSIVVNTELSILFFISLLLEGIASFTCLVYSNFKNFLPTLFYRMTLIFSLSCIILAVTISFSSNRLNYNDHPSESTFEKVD